MFEAYSFWHLYAILVFIVLPISLIKVFSDRLKSSKNEKYVRYSIAGIGILLETWFTVYRMLNNGNLFDIIFFSFCLVVFIATCYYLITKNEIVFNFAYYGAIGGFLTFLFPEVHAQVHSIRFIHFFYVHAIQFVGIYYAYKILDLRINEEYRNKIFIIYLLYAIFNMTISLLAVAINYGPLIEVNLWFMLELPVGQLVSLNNEVITHFVNDVIWVSFIYLVMNIELGIAKKTINYN